MGEMQRCRLNIEEDWEEGVEARIFNDENKKSEGLGEKLKRMAAATRRRGGRKCA